MKKTKNIGAFLLLLILLLCTCACSRVQYVPVETVHSDSTVVLKKDSTASQNIYCGIDSAYLSTFVHDSIWVHDSVYVIEKVDGTRDTYHERTKYIEHYRGDTLYNEKRETQLVSHYQTIIDSLLSVKADTIEVPYPVEKQLTFFQKVKLFSKGLVSVMILLLILYAIYRVRRLFS